MRAVYLTGEDFYLRAMVLDDKDQAVAWFNSPVSIGADEAEKFLKEAHESGWDDPDEMYLAIVRASDDEIIGSAIIEDQGHRTAWLSIRSAPALEDGENLRAKVLAVVIPWLRDEREVLVTRVEIPEDESLVVAAAERLGMLPAMRLREFVARPGHRVDLLGYQALNPKIGIGTNDA
jgi:RimJ/RimL family protein N-acetyltransferase